MPVTVSPRRRVKPRRRGAGRGRRCPAARLSSNDLTLSSGDTPLKLCGVNRTIFKQSMPRRRSVDDHLPTVEPSRTGLLVVSTSSPSPSAWTAVTRLSTFRRKPIGPHYDVRRPAPLKIRLGAGISDTAPELGDIVIEVRVRQAIEGAAHDQDVRAHTPPSSLRKWSGILSSLLGCALAQRGEAEQSPVSDDEVQRQVDRRPSW